MGHDSDNKSKLVTEICSLSTSSFSSCAHRLPFASPGKSHFVDWYRLLGVEENAGADVIRKRYHKLALLLHPDKNEHPKAEVAFKLVLEAYSRLTDKVKRRAFDLERSKNFCTVCNRIPYTSCKPLTSSRESKLEERRPANCQRSSRILWSLKGIRDRFREEAKVMENCMRANSTRRKETPIFNQSDYVFLDKTNTDCRLPRESPVFNPSDYEVEGYPHFRNPIYKRPDNFWHSQGQNVPYHGKGPRIYDSPIFGTRSDAEMFKNKSTFVRS